MWTDKIGIIVCLIRFDRYYDGYVTSVLLLVLDKNTKATKIITIIISVLNVLSTNPPQLLESLQHSN